MYQRNYLPRSRPWAKLLSRVLTTLIGAGVYLLVQRLPWAPSLLTLGAVCAGLIAGHAGAAVARWHLHREAEVPFGDVFVRVVAWVVLPVAALLISVRDRFSGSLPFR